MENRTLTDRWVLVYKRGLGGQVYGRFRNHRDDLFRHSICRLFINGDRIHIRGSRFTAARLEHGQRGCLCEYGLSAVFPPGRRLAGLRQRQAPGKDH